MQKTQHIFDSRPYFEQQNWAEAGNKGASCKQEKKSYDSTKQLIVVVQYATELQEWQNSWKNIRKYSK